MFAVTEALPRHIWFHSNEKKIQYSKVQPANLHKLALQKAILTCHNQILKTPFVGKSNIRILILFSSNSTLNLFHHCKQILLKMIEVMRIFITALDIQEWVSANINLISFLQIKNEAWWRRALRTSC